MKKKPIDKSKKYLYEAICAVASLHEAEDDRITEEQKRKLKEMHRSLFEIAKDFFQSETLSELQH